jgi:hypothetical protein
MRILGVDVTETEPLTPPTPGRAQAWQTTDAGTGELTFTQFTDERHSSTVHTFRPGTCFPPPPNIARPSLSSPPIQTMCSRRSRATACSAGRSPAKGPPENFEQHGYALALLVSSRPSL